MTGTRSTSHLKRRSPPEGAVHALLAWYMSTDGFFVVH